MIGKALSALKVFFLLNCSFRISSNQLASITAARGLLKIDSIFDECSMRLQHTPTIEDRQFGGAQYLQVQS